MRNPRGYGVWSSDSGTREVDSITCGHCQRVVFVKPGSATTVYLLYATDPAVPPREEPGAGCRVCMRPICLTCHAAGRCTPFEQRIEQQEARQRFLSHV